MANLDQIVTPEIFARSFSFQEKGWNPYFYSVVEKQC